MIVRSFKTGAGAQASNCSVKRFSSFPIRHQFYPAQFMQALVQLAFLAGLTGPCLLEAQTTLTLAWNASSSSDVVGYHVYYGEASHSYTNLVSTGNVTNTTINGLIQGTTYYLAATAVDSEGLESSDSTEISYRLGTNTLATNMPPSISTIGDVSVNIGATIPPLAFAVSDAQTPASNLTITASSSNPTLLPNSNIVLGWAGTNRTLTLNLATGQTGTATVTLTVCDPSLCSSRSFVVTVNPLPTVVLTSPANGAIYQSPANITLSANVTPNGHTITQVQFLNGSTLLGTVASSPYNFTWVQVPTGTYSLSAKVVYDSGSTIASAPASITVQGLPAPWQMVLIGNIAIAGNAVISNGLYTVQGAGNISGSADNFEFLFQSLSGDGEIRAQIESVQNSGANGCVGTMIRESLTSGSRYTFMGMSTAGTFRWQRRSNTSGGTSSSKAGNASPPSAWTRLVRRGNTFYGYKSADGTNWSLVNSSTISMATNIYIGLAVASGSSSSLITTAFTNVTVVP